MFKKLSDAIKAKYQRKDELSKQLEIVKVFDIYKRETKKIFPDVKEIKPISMRNKILTVQVNSSVLASVLRINEGDIIERINRSFPNEVVKRINYRF